MKFGEIIREIECSIKLEYLGGAIKWCDDNFDHAWSKSIDRFDLALSAFQNKSHYVNLEEEAGFYKNSVMDLLSKYKASKKQEDTCEFLKTLQQGV
jgi:hypothetical protein